METIKITKKIKKHEDPNAHITNDQMYAVLLILPISMFILAFFYSSPSEIIKGLNTIRLATDVLLTDYFLIAGIGSSLINAALLMLINIYILRRLMLRPNGIIISALFLVGGFGFMGKNIFNVWPFYLGGYIYSRYHHMPYKNVIIISMLSTTLSPITSVLAEVSRLGGLMGFVVTISISSFIGFIMPTISAHVLTAHSGYSLYNMGFAAGLVGIVAYAILQAFGYQVEPKTDLYTQFDTGIFLLLILFCCVLIGIGYKMNGKSFKGLKNVFLHPGRLVTDMIKHVGFGLSLVNMGLLGIVAIGYVILLGGVLNGPIIAGILTVIGFGAFGKHLKNSIPLLIGVYLASFIIARDIPISTIIITGLFATTLAPIIGEYGAIYGLLIGFIHLAVVLNIGSIHGGLHLYNNGLAAGIIATLFVPMVDAFRRERKK